MQLFISLEYLKKIMIDYMNIFGFRDHFINDSILLIVIFSELKSRIYIMISSSLSFSKLILYLNILYIII